MKTLLIFPLVFLALICQGQEHKRIFTINYGIGNRVSIRTTKGGGSGCSCVLFKRPDKPSTTFGVGYSYQTSERLFVETGINYSNFNTIDKRIKDEDQLINVLFKLRHTLGSTSS